MKFRDSFYDPVTWFTGALAWLAFRQWRVYHRQANLMEAALSETKKSTDAVVLLNRPYVDATDWNGSVTVGRSLADEPTFHVGFSLTNLGNTPAEVTVVDVWLDTNAQGAEKIDSQNFGQLVPKHSWPFLYDVQTRRRNYVQMVTDGLHVYVWVAVTYMDRLNPKNTTPMVQRIGTCAIFTCPSGNLKELVVRFATCDMNNFPKAKAED